MLAVLERLTKLGLVTVVRKDGSEVLVRSNAEILAVQDAEYLAVDIEAIEASWKWRAALKGVGPRG